MNGQITHAWPTANKHRAALQNYAERVIWLREMSQSHGIKGETTEEACQVQCFLWESWASVGVGCELLNFKDLLHVQEPILTTEGEKNEKHIRCPLIFCSLLNIQFKDPKTVGISAFTNIKPHFPSKDI